MERNGTRQDKHDVTTLSRVDDEALGPEEKLALRALRATVPSERLGWRARRRVLRAVRRELGLAPSRTLGTRLAASLAALLFASTGLAYASLDAPPESPLFPVRDAVETIATNLTPSPDSKAAVVLGQIERYASDALAPSPRPKAARAAAYRRIKARLERYRTIRSSVRQSRALTRRERAAIRTYLRLKREVAPTEPTITLTTERKRRDEVREEQPPVATPNAPAPSGTGDAGGDPEKGRGERTRGR